MHDDDARERLTEMLARSHGLYRADRIAAERWDREKGGHAGTIADLVGEAERRANERETDG